MIRVPAVTDISGPVWIDLETPLPLQRDEFFCGLCWLTCHVSREFLPGICNECA